MGPLISIPPMRDDKQHQKPKFLIDGGCESLTFFLKRAEEEVLSEEPQLP